MNHNPQSLDCARLGYLLRGKIFHFVYNLWSLRIFLPLTTFKDEEVGVERIVSCLKSYNYFRPKLYLGFLTPGA